MFKIIFWRYRRYLGEETAMPYSLKHKRDTRDKILESARRLFNKRGFSEVSIDEVMENAGLTRGGFYRHFRDKDELYAEAVRRFLCTDAPKPWQPKPSEGMARKPRSQRIVDAYFSRDHFDDRETCCPAGASHIAWLSITLTASRGSRCSISFQPERCLNVLIYASHLAIGHGRCWHSRSLCPSG
jgi:AcrR family transcriptional regulator